MKLLKGVSKHDTTIRDAIYNLTKITFEAAFRLPTLEEDFLLDILEKPTHPI